MRRIVAVRIDRDGDDAIVYGFLAREKNRAAAWRLVVRGGLSKDIKAAVAQAEGDRFNSAGLQGTLPPKKVVE